MNLYYQKILQYHFNLHKLSNYAFRPLSYILGSFTFGYSSNLIIKRSRLVIVSVPIIYNGLIQSWSVGPYGF